MKNFRRFFLTISMLSIILSGCSSSIDVQMSTRLDKSEKPYQSIFVYLYQAPFGWNETEFINIFYEKLNEGFDKTGTKVEIVIVSNSASDSEKNSLKMKQKAFNGEAVLTVLPKMRKVWPRTFVKRIFYNFKLWDAENEKPIWKAEIVYEAHLTDAEKSLVKDLDKEITNLSLEIIAQLQKHKLII